MKPSTGQERQGWLNKALKGELSPEEQRRFAEEYVLLVKAALRMEKVIHNLTKERSYGDESRKPDE